MPKTQFSRRQFLTMSTLSGTGLLLAACGAGSRVVETPTAVSPATIAPQAADEVQVMVRDVLEYALETDKWTGQYGWVRFRLHEGVFNGEPIYYIRTDASNADYASAEGLVYVPLLNQGKEIAQSLYTFSDGRLPVLSTAPSEEDFISLFHIKEITVNDGAVTLDSAAAIETAVAEGKVTLTETNILVNYPIVKWPGGELPVDTDLTETLGKGPLTEAIDTNDKTVTFKLHQCYPGSRYIITDTSAAMMAPMMSIAASPPSQAMMEKGGTDEIWVFANGIPGSGVMGFQPAIFDNKAGQPAWSPFWNHFTLRWTDESKARVLKSSSEVRELVASGDLEQFNGVPDSHPNGFVVNCPAPILAPNTFGEA
ncbi:MAG: hypothetical protein Kow0080_01420 [Candidatus Promineifilaceae bacterium]